VQDGIEILGGFDSAGAAGTNGADSRGTSVHVHESIVKD